jgi:hypothetical protein
MIFPIDQLDAEGIAQVTIEWANGRKAVMTRDREGNWLQVEPVRFPLYPATMNGGLAAYLAGLRHIDSFIPGQGGKPSAAELGLQPSQAVIVVSGVHRAAQLDRKGIPTGVSESPFKQTIRLGAVTAVGSRGYVQINDDPRVYVVDDQLHQMVLMQSPAQWRQRELEVPDEPRVDRVAVSAGGQKYEMVKTAGDWSLAAPNQGRIAAAAVAMLLGNLRRTTVAFADDADKPRSQYGLDSPTVVITVTSSQPRPRQWTLRIGGPADITGASHFATWSFDDQESTLVLRLTHDAKARLSMALDAMRDPRMMVMTLPDMREVQIAHDGVPAVRLQWQAEKGWQFAAPLGGPPVAAPTFAADQDAVTRMLSSLEAAKARYYAASPSPAGKPLASIDIAGTAGRQEQLAVYPVPAGAVPEGEETPLLMVLRNHEQTGYIVERKFLDAALSPILSLRDRQLLTLELADMQRIYIKRYDGVAYDLRRTAASASNPTPLWELAGQSAFESEQAHYLSRLLAELRAAKWLTENPAIGDKKLEITVEMKEGSPAQLVIDAESNQGVLIGEPAGFELAKPVVDYFDAEYRKRSVLQVSLNDIASVTVPWDDGKTLTIGRNDQGNYEVLGPDGSPIKTFPVRQQTAAALFNALAPLRAQRLIEKPDLDPAKAKIRLEILTRDRKLHVLHFGFENAQTTATLGGAWFTLTPEMLATLQVKGIKVEPKPAPQ